MGGRSPLGGRSPIGGRSPVVDRFPTGGRSPMGGRSPVVDRFSMGGRSSLGGRSPVGDRFPTTASEDDLCLTQSTDADVIWEEEEDKDIDIHPRCEICDARMPIFALLAHARFHEMGG